MKKLSLYIFLVLMLCNTVQALPKCEGEDYAQWTNCQGTYLDKDVTKPEYIDKFKITRDFTGEFGSAPGQRQGKGYSKIYKDGSLVLTYFGEYKHDKAQGQGTEIYTEIYPAEKEKYVGEWKDGSKHGQGTEIYSNGSKYVGEFKEDKPNGQGTYTGTDGAKYVGEWSDGLINGQGTYTWSDGRQYVGEFKDDKRYGQGTFIYENGAKYVGEWSDNLFNGQGTYTWSDGRQYVGEFKDDKQHGQGTFTEADGIVKEKGIWKNGKLAEPN